MTRKEKQTHTQVEEPLHYRGHQRSQKNKTLGNKRNYFQSDVRFGAWVRVLEMLCRHQTTGRPDVTVHRRLLVRRQRCSSNVYFK